MSACTHELTQQTDETGLHVSCDCGHVKIHLCCSCQCEILLEHAYECGECNVRRACACCAAVLARRRQDNAMLCKECTSNCHLDDLEPQQWILSITIHHSDPDNREFTTYHRCQKRFVTLIDAVKSARPYLRAAVRPFPSLNELIEQAVLPQPPALKHGYELTTEIEQVTVHDYTCRAELCFTPLFGDDCKLMPTKK